MPVGLAMPVSAFPVVLMAVSVIAGTFANFQRFSEIRLDDIVHIPGRPDHGLDALGGEMLLGSGAHSACDDARYSMFEKELGKEIRPVTGVRKNSRIHGLAILHHDYGEFGTMAKMRRDGRAVRCYSNLHLS